MSLLRASIPDDRGRPVKLLPLCMRAGWAQRGENRLKHKIETPIRWHPKAWIVGLVLGVAVMVAILVVNSALFNWRSPGKMPLWLLLATGISPVVVTLTVWVPGHAALTARWAAMEIRNAYLAGSRCPCCFYSLIDQPMASDGCTVCPECGAAWRLDHVVPGRRFPTPWLLDDSGARVRVRLPLHRRLELAWAGAPTRDRVGTLLAIVLLLVLAPFFGRFAGYPLRTGAQTLFAARWGYSFSMRLQLAFAALAALLVLAIIPFLVRSFWRSHAPAAAKALSRCPACDERIEAQTGGDDDRALCESCGAVWRLESDVEQAGPTRPEAGAASSAKPFADPSETPSERPSSPRSQDA